MPETETTEEAMTVREALAAVADWLESREPGSGWGGPRRPLPAGDAPGLPEATDAADRGPDVGSASAGAAAVGPEAVAAVTAPPVRHPADGGAVVGVADAGGGASFDLGADRVAVDACRACRLGESRRNAAYGEGVANPLVLVVGEGPGAEEDVQGRPFVGPAGQLLDRMLGSIGLSRNTNCYIANIVKCRPPNNREPAPDEREACTPWLERQLEVLRPAIILAMGRTAAATLLGSADGIGKLRGRWFERRGVPLLATYHPSALLRDESLKRPAWEDLKTLKFRLDDEAAVPPGGDGPAGRGPGVRDAGGLRDAGVTDALASGADRSEAGPVAGED